MIYLYISGGFLLGFFIAGLLAMNTIYKLQVKLNFWKQQAKDDYTSDWGERYYKGGDK